MDISEITAVPTTFSYIAQESKVGYEVFRYISNHSQYRLCCLSITATGILSHPPVFYVSLPKKFEGDATTIPET